MPIYANKMKSNLDIDNYNYICKWIDSIFFFYISVSVFHKKTEELFAFKACMILVLINYIHDQRLVISLKLDKLATKISKEKKTQNAKRIKNVFIIYINL